MFNRIECVGQDHRPKERCVLMEKFPSHLKSGRGAFGGIRKNDPDPTLMHADAPRFGVHGKIVDVQTEKIQPGKVRCDLSAIDGERVSFLEKGGNAFAGGFLFFDLKELGIPPGDRKPLFERQNGNQDFVTHFARSDVEE